MHEMAAACFIWAGSGVVVFVQRYFLLFQGQFHGQLQRVVRLRPGE